MAAPTRRPYRRYSTDLKRLFQNGGNPFLASELGIPRSTANGWRGEDYLDLVSYEKSRAEINADVKLVSQLLDSPSAKKIVQFQMAVKDLFLAAIERFMPLKTAFLPIKDRLAALVREYEPILGLLHALRSIGISPAQFAAWVESPDCPASLLRSCLKRRPGQLSVSAVASLKASLSDAAVKHWPLVSVYFKAIREKAVSCALPTFYKYAKALGFSGKRPRHRRKNHTIGLRADRPNRFWHADVTVYKTADNVKAYIYLVVDNFSRKVLAWNASLTLSGHTRMETLVAAYRRHIQVRPRNGDISLVVDGGPENMSIPAYDPETAIRKLVAQKDVLFSNSMAEAPNKMLKYGYLYLDDPPDFNALISRLDKAFDEFNAVRPHGQLGGVTPDEAYSGLKPEDFIPRLKKSEERARREAENRQLACAGCS